jgi:GNAT superfamily N-acetyltransferase
MPGITDIALYARSTATLLASWEAYVHGSDGGSLQRLEGVAAAVFPRGPEHAFFNNAVLERDLGPRERRAAIDALAAAYAAAGIDRYAAWVHESDGAMRAELEARGYAQSETTRAMALSLEDIPALLPDADYATPGWAGYLELLTADDAVPDGLLAGADPSAFHVAGARLDGVIVAAGISFDHDGDCGVFNVETTEHARRRGLGTAVTTRLLHDARARGCTTASLQSTPIAERVYARVGFRDLGRIIELAPPTPPEGPT